MCRGKANCIELPKEIKFWSKNAPLIPPRWFKNEIDLFSEAVKLAAKGEVENSIKLLKTIKSN